MTPTELQTVAAVLNQHPYWCAYAMGCTRPDPIGFLFWNAERWRETRARLGLQDYPGALPGALFGEEHLATLAATVPAQ